MLRSKTCPRDASGAAIGLGVALALAPVHGTHAIELSDSASADIVLTSVMQQGSFSGTSVRDGARGTFVAEVALSFEPSEKDAFGLRASAAAGNAFNDVNPLSLAPYADDLEDDVTDINGTTRDYLLSAWYRHRFVIGQSAGLAVTAGLIDSTGYLDANAFANDEGAQFMNEAFVNNPLLNLPSYDPGIALELEGSGGWSFRTVWMSSKNVDPDNGLDRRASYIGAEVGYSLSHAGGSTSIRLTAYGTTDDFRAASGGGTASQRGLGLSADHRFNSGLGLFARLGWQDDGSMVTHDRFLSAGLSVGGTLWGREDDEIGLAYGYLEGTVGNPDTNLVEAFSRFQLSEFSNLTFDVQFLNDDAGGGATAVEGVLLGARLNAYF